MWSKWRRLRMWPSVLLYFWLFHTLIHTRMFSCLFLLSASCSTVNYLRTVEAVAMAVLLLLRRRCSCLVFTFFTFLRGKSVSLYPDSSRCLFISDIQSTRYVYTSGGECTSCYSCASSIVVVLSHNALMCAFSKHHAKCTHRGMWKGDHKQHTWDDFIILLTQRLRCSEWLQPRGHEARRVPAGDSALSHDDMTIWCCLFELISLIHTVIFWECIN